MSRSDPVRPGASLRWDEHLGLGYYPVLLAPGFYGREYWDRYVAYRANSMSGPLVKTRAALVERHCGPSTLVDIGIGSGHFIEDRSGATYGYDVNPIAIRWLLDRGLWWDPYARPPEAVCCWDSLEHMDRPELLVSRVARFVFISIPIFTGRDHALASKHFKPREHFWYFTREGLIRWMDRLGFTLLEANESETDLGREDIGTFAFKRVRTGRTPVPPANLFVPIP